MTTVPATATNPVIAPLVPTAPPMTSADATSNQPAEATTDIATPSTTSADATSNQPAEATTDTVTKDFSAVDFHTTTGTAVTDPSMQTTFTAAAAADNVVEIALGSVTGLVLFLMLALVFTMGGVLYVMRHRWKKPVPESTNPLHNNG